MATFGPALPVDPAWATPAPEPVLPFSTRLVGPLAAIAGAPVARAAFPGSVGEASGERVDPLAQPAATRTMETNRQASCGVRLGIDVSRGVTAVVSEQMMESFDAAGAA